MKPEVGDLVQCVKTIQSRVFKGEIYKVTKVEYSSVLKKYWIGFVMKREYPYLSLNQIKSIKSKEVEMGTKANWAFNCFKIVSRPGWNDQTLKVLFGESDETR